MNSQDFVYKIKQFTPKIEDLRKLELSDDYLNKLIASYNLQRKNNEFIFNVNPIIELIENYDVSVLEIGMVTLNNKIEENEKYYLIGQVEVDLLVINKITLELEVLDYHDTNYSLWKCAASAKNFLSALVDCSEYLGSCMFDDTKWSDSKKILIQVEKVTKIAGGNDYKDFYLMLLGYFEE